MTTADKAHPYIKFYGRDWIGDTALRMCSIDERGLWIDLLCLMMQGEPYGHLAINGRALSDDEVSRTIGLELNTYKGTLYRLMERGIPSKTESGMIFSRRLVRDHERFVVGSISGKKGGGNPRLRKKKSESRIHIPEAKGRLKVPYIDVSIPVTLSSIEGFDKLWSDFLENRAAKKAKATPRAQELLLIKLQQNPNRAMHALETAITRNWTSFEWDWIDGKTTTSAKQPSQFHSL
jgi:hypothetical protein